MTEKRFKMIITNADGSFHYLDEITGEKITSTLELEDKLNELNEENQALKERRHEDINDLSVIAMKYNALEEENKEFKEEIRMLNELLGERELAEYRRKEYDEFWAKKKRIMGL